MTNQLLLLVLGATVLLGGALVWARRTDRRRQSVQQRLHSIATMTRDADDETMPRVSLLRQTLAQARSGGFSDLSGRLWARLDPAFAATGNRIGMPHLIAAGGVAGAATIGFVYGILGLNLALAIVLGGAAAAASAALLLHLMQARYQNRFLDAFPDALDLVGRAVKAGLPVSEAMAVAGREIADPVGSELRQTLEQVRIGVEMGDALQQTADRIRVPDFRFLVVALALQKKTGGSLAETLGNLSGVIRARKMLRLKARALSSEAKASAFVLALLPFFVGGMLFFINRDLMSVLLRDPRGRFMLGIAFLSLVTGISVMVTIIKRALR